MSCQDRPATPGYFNIQFVFAACVVPVAGIGIPSAVWGSTVILPFLTVVKSRG